MNNVLQNVYFKDIGIMRNNSCSTQANAQVKITIVKKFLKNFWRTQVLFVGPLIPLFWTSDDVVSGF